MRTDSRNLRFAIPVAVLIITIAGTLAFDHSRQNAQRRKVNAPSSSSSPSIFSAPKSSAEVVNLPGGAFDPIVSMPAGTLRGGETSAMPDDGYYIVQFDKTADDEMLARLRRNGVEVLQYLPSRAFYVYAPGGSAANAAEEQNVRWVGRLLPEHKIPPVLAEQLNAVKGINALPSSIAPLQMASKGAAVFDIAVFKREDLKTVSSQIALITGGTVRDLIELPGNFFNVVRIEVAPDAITSVANVEGVFRIDAWSKPVAEDERAAQIVAGNYASVTAIDAPGYDPLTQFGVDGTGITVSVVDDGVGIPGDGGFYITASNTVNGPLRGASAGALGHGHLNASIIAGDSPFSSLDSNGYNYGLGVAPKAHIINIPLLRPGYSGTEANTMNDTVATSGPNGVRGFVSNNSWGNGTNGNTYDSFTAQYDGFVRDASSTASIDPLLIVFSAGNSGTGGLTRPKMSKNTIAVANLENVRTELSSSANNMDDLDSSSSIGPGADGRIKPDIAAPGTAVAGGRSGTDSLFGNIDAYHRWSTGTSHAAPQVAGAAALFTQFWNQNNSGANPSPALVKAALINGAVEVNGVSTGSARPNGFEGWGRINLKNVLNTGAAVTYINETDSIGGTGAARNYLGTVADPARPLRITLVWTDPPGAADPALVNDLDLEVIAGGRTYKGNVFSSGSSAEGGIRDSVNNVENVFLPAGQSGPLFVRVKGSAINGDGILGNGDSTDQHFALVVHNGTVVPDSSAFLVRDNASILSGNAILEPNECNLLNIPITNNGETAATGVSATLTSLTPGVSVSVANANYPDLAPGATAVGHNAFLLSTDNTLACLTSVDLALSVTFAGGPSPIVHNFTMKAGQPGGTNYSFTTAAGAAISTGGSLVAGSNVDDAVVDFTAPFAFSVYGTNVPAGSNIRLGTNGYIRIESAGAATSSVTNTSLPANGSGTFPSNLPVLMPYWDDLDMKPSVTADGGIYTEVTGSTGSRTLKIEWRARPWVAAQPPAAPSVNFAVYFHEGSNSFEYVYALTGPGSFSGGASATVGVQSATAGTEFTQYSYNTASLSPGLMISASLAPPVCSSGTGGCIFTAALASLRGRVVTPDGRGVKGARVTLSDGTDIRASAMTNTFGYFRFDGIPAGGSYILTPSARGLRFESQIVQLGSDLSDLTFVASH